MAGEKLTVSEGKERGKRMSVGAELLIGREAPEDDGRLGGDREISRRHARVSRGDDGLLRIEDLRSANGTFVNGERIDAPRTLAAGDVVRLGQTVLQVTDASGAVPQAAGAPTDPHRALLQEAAHELVVTAGTARGRRLELTDELVIGRAVSGEGRLGDDPELSRRHARVAREPGGELVIEDLGSANGTFVNGERVQGRRRLKVGESVQVGSTTLQLTELGRAPAPAPAPLAPAPVAKGAPPRAAAAPSRSPARPSPAPAGPPAPRRPAPSAPGTTAGEEGLAAELPLGSVFAGCRVDEVISRGEMGLVYRAEELALQRPVALKLILPEHSRDERFRKRFERESMVAASIDHPNVVPILDAGDEDGVLFITMRLVEGTDLRSLIGAEGRLEPLRAARIVRQTGAALDAAHARGLLHRDVKPANILLGREEHVYLSDFGLAKRADEEGGMTRQGSIIARAEYVAPEQILNERVDARADIYALGCMLFETITGEPPFARWKEGPAALAHVNAPRPSPLELRPDLPREFDDVVWRAMAKDPGERYPSAGDLGEAALVAAGGLQQARQWSVVATGEAAPYPPGTELPSSYDPAAEAPAPPAPAEIPAGHERAAAVHADGSGIARPTSGADAIRWGIALAALALVAVGMVAALTAISNL